MAISSDRTSYFPIIEKRYGEKMSYWFAVMKKLEGKKYPEQIAHLKENYGFNQSHANALVMYSRGSTTTKKFNTLNDYLKDADPKLAKLAKQIFKSVQAKYPSLELEIAWNKPQLKLGDQYVLGLAVLKNYILLAPFTKSSLDEIRPKLKELEANKKTIHIPADWKVDEKLMHAMAAIRIKEIKDAAKSKSVKKTVKKTVKR